MAHLGSGFKWLLRVLLVVLVIIVLLLVSFRAIAYLREEAVLGDLPPQGGRLVKTERGSIYVLEKGSAEAPPVLFAHGTAAWSGLWLPTLEFVGANQYRAIAFDMPPFGYSEYPMDQDYSRGAQARRFLSLLQALDVKPIVVAHSFGAGAIAEAAAINPDAFGGLVIVAGAIGLQEESINSSVPLPLKSSVLRELASSATITNPLLTGTFLRQFIHIKSGATDDRIEVLKQPIMRKGYTTAAAHWIPELLVPPTGALSTKPETWRELSVPTTFIWGDKDTITPLAQAQTLNSFTAGGSLTVLPDVGHIPQIEAPDLFQEKLLIAIQGFSHYSNWRMRP